ncbi:hypothetical protein TNCV_2556811 [Trichonephila clavipes]|nr:hypothetical protein TNCV_2556811 [Trichonephila clavipes]
MLAWETRNPVPLIYSTIHHKTQCPNTVFRYSFNSLSKDSFTQSRPPHLLKRKDGVDKRVGEPPPRSFPNPGNTKAEIKRSSARESCNPIASSG